MRLNLAGVFAARRRQRHAAGHEHRRQVAHAGQRHHHRGMALVARGHADARRGASAASGSAAAARSPRRCDRPGCRTCPPCPACGRRTGRSRTPANGTPPRALHFAGRRFDQQADFPVAGVIAQRDRRAVGGADAAQRAEDEELLAAQLATASNPSPRPATSRTDRRWAACGASRR